MCMLIIPPPPHLLPSPFNTHAHAMREMCGIYNTPLALVREPARFAHSGGLSVSPAQHQRAKRHAISCAAQCGKG